MAIFGDLADFSFREIISVIGKRNGMLIIDDRRGKRLRLQITREHLTRLTLEQPIRQGELIQKLLQTACDNAGTFYFKAGPADAAETPPVHGSLALSSLLEPAHATAPPATVLPHADTRFILIPSRVVTLDRGLKVFLDHAQGLLEKGCSANQLAQALHMNVEHVRGYLHRLREVKKVWPVRAHQEHGDSPQLTEQRSLARRLIGLFRQ